MRLSYKLPDQAYYSIVFRAFALDAKNTKDNSEKLEKWKRVTNLISEKNPAIPYITMGEFCLEAGNRDLAVTAIRKEKKYNIKVEMLINAEAWDDAVEVIFSN